MTNKEVLISYEGLKAKEEELEYLKTVKRKEVSEKIKTARGYGDLSENSEYDEAKNEQAIVEAKILQLEAMLKNARIIDENELTTETVNIGCRVKLKWSTGEKETYDLVTTSESDPLAGKISDVSPIGAALMGKKAGETVSATLPSGETVDIKIVSIEKS